MNQSNNLTTGNVAGKLVQFALPYLLACFLQTFYGLADLYVVGLFHGAATITAVSIGSQVTHMLTVVLAGLAMGTTVLLARAVGAGETKEIKTTMGTSMSLFAVVAFVLTFVLFLASKGIVSVMMTPAEACRETELYLRICFLGIPFIVAYNVMSSMFRGLGDSKSPLYFVGVACVINILLDFLLVGYAHMGAVGAALATVCGQAISSIVAMYMLFRRHSGYQIHWRDCRPSKQKKKEILLVGAPIALQDGLIQISFLLITVIANSRGLVAATSVGIVEKLIGFFFLVPSAFLSAISAITAQNMGAGKPERGVKTLWTGLVITVTYGLLVSLLCQFWPGYFVGLFTKEKAVYLAGCAYLMSYGWDVMFASIHFCFSGYFCGIQKSVVSFIHNIIAIVLMRIPGAYVASLLFPEDLYPMGWAAPIGSILSSVICIGVFYYWRKKKKET